MIDIHSHILPKVDDGSKDLSMSIEMAKMYLDSGIKTVIATPHYIEESNSSTKDRNIEVLEKLKMKLNKESIDLEILLGNEAYVSMDLVSGIEKGDISTLNNTRYLLVELPMYDIPLYVESLIYELLIKGYVPIIAHPERNSKIQKDPNILYSYIQKGALAQMNLPSLEGKYGLEVKEIAEILAKHKMIHFLGTDAHSNRNRSPRVKNALRILEEVVTEEEFENLLYRNPKQLLKDQRISINKPIEYDHKKTKNFGYRALKKISSFIF